MNANELLDLIGNARSEYVMEAQAHRESTGQVHRFPARRILLIAAVIAMLVALVGFAAIVLDLDALILGGFTAENHLGEQVDMDVISLQGFSGSKNYLAAQEWQSYCAEHGDSNSDYIPPADYAAYLCTDEDMVRKVDEISGKYGLALLGALHLDSGLWDTCDAVGIGSIFSADSGVALSEDSGYHFRDGTFQVSGVMTMANGVWPHPITFQLRSVQKTAFDGVYIGIWSGERYEQWSYTTRSGVQLLMALSSENALMFCDRDDCFITVSVISPQYGEEIMERADLEAMAEALVFDYTVQPAKTDVPADNETVYYSDYADYITELLDAGAVVSYAIEQVDGRDDEELLIFEQDGTIREILTVRDGFVQTMGKGGSLYLCDYYPIVPSMDATAPDYVYIFRVIEQEADVEGAVQHDYMHIGEDGQGMPLDTLREYPNGSYGRCIDGQWQTVSEQEYRTIIEQYRRMTLDRAYIGEFFGEHTPDYTMFDTAYLPIARGEVTRDWDSVQAFLTERGYACRMSEGTYSAADPKNPDSYLLGYLTTENGYLELADVGYRLVLGDAVREVCSVFQGGGAEYRVNVSPWREGLCVPVIAEQERFIKEFS